MSKTVDEKVVEMRFDNQDFEHNVKTSINTLQRLKDNLDFSGLANGFDSISKAASKVDFSGFTVAIDTVTEGFSALEAIAFSALQRITNEAITAGTRFASELAIDPVTTGFDKFAQKTEAVQTIMAATNMSAEDVTNSLEKLVWFSDETSYNFIDMVNSVGKFTSAGKTLDEAMTSIMGIANWAAVSGQNAEVASRAMYQLAQAMGTGAVKGQDWASIEAANMATMEFKQTVIETAEEMGILVKYGDMWAASDPASWGEKKDGTPIEKWITPEKFRNVLGEEGWFTSDVLIKTLQKYGKYSDAIYEISDAYELCSEAMEAFDKSTDISADKAMQLSQKAFKAGQVSKTFADAVNAVKDSVSSGWMNTFEIIFGNFDEATELWTNVNDAIFRIFGESQYARNEMLAAWKEEGRDPLLNGITQIYETFMSVGESIKTAFDKIFPPMTADRLIAITKRFEEIALSVRSFVSEVHDFGEPFWTKIWDTLTTPREKVTDVYKAISDLTGKELGGWAKQTKPITDGIDIWKDTVDEAAKILMLTDDELDAMRSVTGDISADFYEVNQEMGESIYEWSDLIDSMAMDVIKGNWGNDPFRQEELEAAGYNYAAIQNRVNEIVYGFEEWHEYIGDLEEATRAYNAQVNGIVESVDEVSEAFEEVGEEVEEALPDTILTRLQRTFKGLFAIIDIVGLAFKAVGEAISPITGSIPELIWHVTGLTASLGDFVVGLRDTIRENNTFGNAIKKVIDFVSEAFWRAIGNFETLEEKEEFLLNARDTIIGYFTAVRDWATSVGDTVRDYVERMLGIKDVEDETERSTILWDKYSKVMEGVRKVIGGIVSAFQLLAGGVQTVFTVLQHPISWLTGAIGKLTGLVFGLATSAGEAITNLKNSAKETGFFEGIIQNVSAAFGETPTVIGTVIENLKKIASEKIFPKLLDYFNNVATAMSDLFKRIMHPNEEEEDGTTFLEKVVTKIQAIGSTAGSVISWIANAVSTAVNGLWTALNTAVPSIGSWLLRLGDAIVGLIERIINSIGAGNGEALFQEISLEALFGWLTGSALGGILSNLNMFTTDFGSVWLKFKNMLQNATWWLEEHWDTVRYWGQMIGANINAFAKSFLTMRMMKTVASSILMVAAALLMISFVDADRLEDSFVVLSGIMVVITAIGMLVSNMDVKGVEKFKPLALYAIAFSVAVTILAGALKKVAKIDPEKLWGSAGALVVIITAFAFSLNQLDTSKMAGTASGILAFSAGILILALAIKSLYNTFSGIEDIAGIIAAVASVVVVLGLIVVLAKSLTKLDTTKLAASGIGILGFAAAIHIVVAAIKTLMDYVLDSEGNVDWDRVGAMFAGMVTVAVLMVTLGFTLSKFPEKKAIAAALAVRAVGITVEALVGAILVLGEALSDSEKTGGIVGAIVGVVVAIISLAGALWLLDSLTYDPQSSATAMLTMAAGIFVLSAALAILGSIPVLGLVAGFVTLVVTLLALAGAAVLLQGLTVPITALATAFLIFGAASLLTGLGLQAIATGLLVLGGTLVTIAAIGTAITVLQDLIVAVLGAVGIGLVSLATNVIEGLGDLILKICDIIVKAAPAIAAAVIAFFLSFTGVLIAKQAAIFAAIGIIISLILAFLASKAPEFGASGFEIGWNFLAGIWESIKKKGKEVLEWFASPFENAIKVVKGILGEHSPSTVFAEIGSNCLEGFAIGVKDNEDAVGGSLIDVFGDALGGLGSFFGDLFGFGKTADTQVAKGVDSNSSTVSSSFDDVMDFSIDGLYDYSDDFFDIGSFDISSMSGGFDYNSWMFSSSMSDTTWGALATGYGYYGDFVTLGSAMGEGYMEGLRKMADAVRETAGAAIGGNSLAGIGAIIEYNSPSHAAERMGHGLGEGYILGMEAIASDVFDASAGLGNESLDGLKGAIQRAGDLAEDELAFSPTIRPVLDMSNVMAGRGYLQNLLNGTNKSIDIAGAASARIEAKQLASIDGLQVNNKNVVEAITAMRGDISDLSDAVKQMQIVMDTGVLVGAIAEPMDSALGRRAIYAGRGI